MAKRKRVRISADEREQWANAIFAAVNVLSAAASRIPEPNLIAAISLANAAELNIRSVPTKDGQ